MMFQEKDLQPITLYQLNLLIKQVLDEYFYRKYFWVKAEIHKLNVYKYSGHAYPELLEKQDNEVVCQMRGIIWKSDLTRINQKFIETIGEPLKENIYALLLVEVKFEPKYGLSLQIKDIDPNYTLGELEKQKKQTIEKLKNEGILENNKKLELSLVPQRLAIISVETSKGFNDLITTFKKFEGTYQIQYQLFPSLLQGEEAAIQIKEQLLKIADIHKKFDAVLIIRGGGGEVGLSCYNDYELCKTIATFPIPVITGIGHSTNFTVAEMVAYQNGITPTDTAMLIIHKFQTFEEKLNTLKQTLLQNSQVFFNKQQQIINDTSKNILITIKETFHQQKLSLQEYEQWLKNIVKNYIIHQDKKLIQKAHQIKHFIHTKVSKENLYLNSAQQKLNFSFKSITNKYSNHIQLLQKSVIEQSKYILNNHYLKLQSIEKHLQIMHPDNILKRGFTIAFDANNNIIKNPNILKENHHIKIKFYKSELEAQLKNIQIKNL
ncbi:MAG: exodeoxyribonuclease 7 large subunit [Bacteroidia bacterium]|nr:MAG: exodeoxyribonuclease 7 large subunit [Bacteroidia bacterium]